MKKKIQKSLSIFFIIFFSSLAQGQELLPFLKNKFGNDVEYHDSSAYKEFYTIRFRQLIDHTDSSKGFFTQRVYLGHNSVQKPIVLMTDGYEAPPIAYLPKLKTEVVKFLDANQLFVEHRYFGKSIPDSTDLKWLNHQQVSGDYHAIKASLSAIYQNKWISLGISKGGQATINYAFYYPGEMDARIAYVTPLMRSKIDRRIERFLAGKRKTDTGRMIFEIQQHLLKNKKRLLPVFSQMVTTKGAFDGMASFERWSGQKMDMEALYDFGVLEFDFNYWQYIGSYETLMEENKDILEKLKTKGFSNAALLSWQDSLVATLLPCIYWMLDTALSSPFLYQAFTENGFYRYKEKLFRPYLKYKTYSLKFLVGGMPVFNKKYKRAFNKFIKTGLARTIFIYGADDPYTASYPIVAADSDNLIIVNPATNHHTQIRDLSSSDKKKIADKLSKWLGADINLQ